MLILLAPEDKLSLIPTLPLHVLGLRTWESAGTCASNLKAHIWGVKCPGQVAPTTGLKLWFSHTQGGGHPSAYYDRNF